MEGQFAALSTEVCLFITALPEGKPCTTFGSGLIGSRGGIEALVGPSAGFLLLSAAALDQLHPPNQKASAGRDEWTTGWRDLFAADTISFHLSGCNVPRTRNPHHLG